MPLYVSVFPPGWDVTETAVSRRRSNLQVVRLGLHFLLNNYNALVLIKLFLLNTHNLKPTDVRFILVFDDFFCAWSLTHIQCSHRWQIWLEWGHYRALALSHWTWGHKITATLSLRLPSCNLVLYGPIRLYNTQDWGMNNMDESLCFHFLILKLST